MAITVNPDAAFGARPVGTLTGASWHGAMRRFTPEATLPDTDVYRGSIMEALAQGSLDIMAATDVGVQLVGAVVGVVPARDVAATEHPGYLPASTAGSFYCTIDPFVIFEMQEDGVTDVIALLDRFANFAVIGPQAGSTTTGLSSTEIDSDTHSTTNSLPIKLLDLVLREDNVQGDETGASANANWLILFNEHFSNHGDVGI